MTIRRDSVSRLILASILCLATIACSRLPSLPGTGAFGQARPETPLPYPSRLAQGDGSAQFAVAVTSNGAPLDAVRESVRFPATRYCMRHFGTSDIDWAAPAGTPEAWTGRADAKGQVVYAGRCTGR